MSDSYPYRRYYWPLQIGGWTLYAAIGFASAALFTPQRVEGAIIAGSGCLILLLSTHLLRLRARRRGWTRLGFGKLAPRVLIATFLIAAFSQILVSLLMFWPLDLITPERPYSVTVLALYIFQTQLILALWSLIYFSFHALRNYKSAEIDRWRLQAAVKDAELIALKAQINPHFIFNCLNNIRSLVIEDPEDAREAITRLSELLRYSIRFNQAETVPLRDEIEIVQDYLALESIHLESRLRYEIELDPDTLELPIPPMTVQLLVENAIKHSIAKLPRGGEIAIRSRRFADHAEIVVENTGQIAAPDAASTGIGLRNARERLRLLCGDEARLDLANASPEAVSATVLLPAAQPAANRA